MERDRDRSAIGALLVVQLLFGRVLGIVLALAGVIVLTLQAAQQGRMHLVGDLLILANALSYAAFLVLAKPVTQRHDPLSLTTWVFVIGAVFFVPVGFAMGLREQVAAAPPSTLGWMLFIILGATVFTYALNTLALRRVHASTVAAFTYVQPVFTAAASYLLLGERLRWVLLPAAALVFAGVWLVARRDPPALQGQGQVVAE